MRRSSMIFTFLLLLFTLSAQAQFEGAINMKVTMADENKSEPMLYNMQVKNNLMATTIKSNDGTSGGGRFIFRGDKQALWIVNDADKSFIEISMKNSQDKNQSKVQNNTEDKKAKIQKTGKTETILGYLCSEVIIDEGKNVTQIWGTSKLGNFYENMMKSFGDIGGNSGSMNKAEWEEELAALKLFPMKIISLENGKVMQTQEVTEIQSKSIPNSVFDLPKDYKKQVLDPEMEKLMKEMPQQKSDFKEKDANDPGMNPDMEKMMKQLEEMQKADTSGGDR